MSVEKRLDKANKYLNQGRLPDAIYEYRRILAEYPDNKEAGDALRSLTDNWQGEMPDEPPSTNASNASIKTNFFARQAQESSVPPLRQAPVVVLLVLVGLGVLYGLLQAIMYFVNYDKTVAMKYVEVNLLKPVEKEGVVYVSAQINNLNPQELKSTTFQYQITGEDGTKLAGGTATIASCVPAGDIRTFSDVKLSAVSGQARHMNAELVDVSLGPVASMKHDLANKFIEACAKNPADAVADFTAIVKACPQFGPGFIRLGQALLAAGDKEHAVKAFQKAIKIDCDDANAHYHLGVAYFYLGESLAARKEFELASRLAPDDAVISSALADVRGGGETK